MQEITVYTILSLTPFLTIFSEFLSLCDSIYSCITAEAWIHKAFSLEGNDLDKLES